MRVVICGGAGFVGVNLCRNLLRRDDIEQVVVVDDLSGGDAEAVDRTGARLVPMSILDTDLLGEVVSDADAIVNLVDVAEGPWAGGDPGRAARIISDGAGSVLEAARRAGRPHVIAASTSAVYGANMARPAHEELEVMPLTPHAAAFCAAEARLASASGLGEADVLVLRLFDTFGPHRPAGHPSGRAVHECLHSALTGEEFVIRGDGHERLEVTSVGFVCSALSHAITWRTTSALPVNLATGRRISAIELIGEVAHLTGERISVRHSEAPASRHHIASTRRFVRTMGALHVDPFGAELATTWDWVRAKDALAV